MTQLRFSGWRPGLKKVALSQLLRDGTDLTLASAKDVVDRVLEGQSVVVDVDSPDEAQALADAADALGANCEIIETPGAASAERQ